MLSFKGFFYNRKYFDLGYNIIFVLKWHREGIRNQINDTCECAVVKLTISLHLHIAKVFVTLVYRAI